MLRSSCLSVLYVCQLAYLKNRVIKLHEIFRVHVYLPVAVAQCSSHNNTMFYALVSNVVFACNSHIGDSYIVGIRVYSYICRLNLHTRNRYASQSRQLVRPRCLAG